jgi:5-methylcytosine-specific restriction endonuclease McrA
MPIDYKKYPKDWKLISRAIINEQNNSCFFCPAENYKPHWKTGSKVVLTVAHLDSNIKNNSKYNLRGLCQRCHLLLDLELHIFKRFKIDKNYWIDKITQLKLI